MADTFLSSDWIISIINNSCATGLNRLDNCTDEPAWGTPLVGFASGDDPLFGQYKQYVGPFHWTPVEIFNLAHPDKPVEASDLTVISWVLPQTKATKRDNREMDTFPAERWARSRIYGEQFNNALRKQVVSSLTEGGCATVAPMLNEHFETKASKEYIFASTWSERHAAFAAGLGTFGLCDGLITPVGKAMRVGSVVTHLRIPPSTRAYTDHQAYCLYFAKGTCGECISRCPVDAIGPDGHDKIKCGDHVGKSSRAFVRDQYHFEGYGCGLCQTGVPCESGIPEGLTE